MKRKEQYKQKMEIDLQIQRTGLWLQKGMWLGNWVKRVKGMSSTDWQL